MNSTDLTDLIPVSILLGFLTIALGCLTFSFENDARKWKAQCKKRGLLEYRQADGSLVWKDDGEVVPMGEQFNDEPRI